MPSEQPQRLDSLLWCLSRGGSEAPDVGGATAGDFSQKTQETKSCWNFILNKQCGF